MSKKFETNGPLPLKIAGTGCYVPKRVVTGKEIEAGCGLEPGWCAAHLGVEERRWVEEETPSFMGAEVAREAVTRANMELEDIDLIINASGTASFERGLPDGGPMVQKQLGLENSGIPAFTIQNNDLSFMLALEAGAAWLASGRYENILVVSSEIFSLNLDTNNPEVYGLFGDGAAAAVVTLTPPGETSGIHYTRQQTYSRSAHCMQCLMGLAASKREDLKTEDLTLQMNAPSFKEYGNKYTRTLIEEMSRAHGAGLVDIQVVIPQQIGKFYTDFLQNSMGIPGEKIIYVADRLGFCGAASLPMALHQAVEKKKLKRGDRFMMIGIGAGISVGGMIMTF
jgi:3-oxoacyl-[acyl-carrier-protein] synthase-3